MTANVVQNNDFSKQNAEKLQEKILPEVEQVTLLPMPIGEKRLQTPISIVHGTKPEIVEIKTLDELFNRLQSTDATALQQSKALQNAYISDKEKYKHLKSNCEGFILGLFDYRNDKHCKQYAPIIAFDIDGYEDAFYLSLDIAELRKDPFVFAVFPSPSGHGLRILIWADTSPETHKLMYELIVKYLCDILHLTTDKKNGVHLDISTSNISRHWYYSAVNQNDFYLNLDSQVFVKPVMVVEKSMTKQQKALKQIETERLDETTFSVQEKYDFCVSKMKNVDSYGGRNNYIFRLACSMYEHGIVEHDILTFCSRFVEKDFPNTEIEKAVKSAVLRAQFEKYSDANIAHYQAKQANITSISMVKPKKVPKLSDDEATPVTSKAKGNGKTKIDKIINFCTENYQLRFNEIAIEVESSVIEQQTFEPLNTNDLLIDLLRNKINGCERLLKNYLSSTLIERYDPFKNYFENLPKWKEGDTDYITQLARYVEVKDRFFFDNQFKKMLVRMLACGVGELPFNKQCIVFVGKQNDGKTSFIRFLCPPILKKYIKENLEMDKDGRLALCQNFIINLDELATLSKQDINQIKSYFTTETVKERPPYGDKPVSFKRRASFIASTNNEEFLTDETGNVRWVVFKIDGINHDSGGENGYNKKVDINLVWSQAYALYKSGFEFQLTAQELEHSEKNNLNHRKTFTEYELLQEFFMPAKKDEEGAIFKNTTAIKEDLESGVTTRKLNVTMIGKALKSLGFENTSKYNEQTRISIKGYWVKPIIEIIDTTKEVF